MGSIAGVRFNRKAFSIGASLALALTASVSLADDTGTTAPAGTNVTTPQFQGTAVLNGGFSACAAQSMTDPINQITQILQSRGQNGKSGSNGKNGSNGAGGECSLDDIPSATDVQNCSQYENSDGTWNSQDFTDEQNVIKTDLTDANACESGLAAVKQQITCLQTQGNMLAQQVNSLKSVYQQNIQRFQTDTNTLKSMESDRKNQLALIDQKLNGGGSSGEGLKAAQARLEGMINSTIPTAIQNANNERISILNAQNALNEQAQNMTMNLTAQCFSKTTVPTYHCPTADSPALSPEAFIVCRYQQNQGLAPNGAPMQNSSSNADATAAGNNLQGVLDNMLSDVSQEATVPETQTDVQNQMNATIVAYTPTDLSNLFAGQLSAFNGRGIQVEQFVMQTINNYCYPQAENTVATERTQSNNALGVAAQQLQQRQRTNEQDFQNQLQTYSEEYAKDTADLTGQHLPLNVTACNNATPDVQASCLQSVLTTLENLDNGNTSSSAVPITLPAQNSGLTVTFTCQGLQGCITALQTASTNVTSAQQQLTTFQTSYNLQARQSTENFTNQMAGMMSGQSQQLTARLQSINTTLGNLGVQNTISLQPVTAEQLQYDSSGGPDGDQGIPKVPTNMMNLIGGLAQPPMLNISGNDFSDAESGIAQEKKSADKNLQAVQKAQQAMKSAQQSCEQKVLTGALTTLKGDAQNVETCGSNYQFCNSTSSTGGAAAIQSLQGTIDQAASGLGVITNGGVAPIDSYLTSGAANCQQTVSAAQQGCTDAKNTLTAAANSFCGSCASTNSNWVTICGSATSSVTTDNSNCGSYAQNYTSALTALHNAKCTTSGQVAVVGTADCPALSEASQDTTILQNISNSFKNAGSAGANGSNE